MYYVSYNSLFFQLTLPNLATGQLPIPVMHMITLYYSSYNLMAELLQIITLLVYFSLQKGYNNNRNS